MRHHALMYHDVLRPGARPSGRTGAGPDRYKLSWSAFVEHLDRIATAVGKAPDATDDLRDLTAPSRWSLTFDDGGASALDIAVELGRRGWRGYFFVTTGTLGRDGFVDDAGVRELARLGHVVGSHSVSHPARMSALSLSELAYEWQASCDVLSELVGRPIRTASVPGGYHSRAVATAAAHAGIATLFTSAPSPAARATDGCLVAGRYVVRHDTDATAAAKAAAGAGSAWLRQYAGWSVRRPVKAIGGDRYLRLRKSLVERSNQNAR